MSMLLCVVTPLAVFMAADSRQYPSGADTVQKVFLVGKDAIVSHGGIGVIPHDGGSWDAAEELKRIAAATASGTFQEQFNFIRQQVMSSISVALRHYTARFSNNPHELNRVAVVGFDRAPWRLARGSGKLDSVIPQ